ncbi:MAG: NlpC/P60 family protein [Geobacteraceae bacterium]
MRNGMHLVVTCVILLTFPSLALAAKNHRIKKYDTLYSLAKKHHVSVADLKSANNMVDTRLRLGDTLVIPSRTVSAGREKKAQAQNISYRVKKGDNLTRVAKKTGVSICELKQLNGLGSGKGKLKPGQMLVLRSAHVDEEPAPRVAKRTFLRHEELFSEKEYETSLSELTESDSISPPDLSRTLELKTDNVRLLKKSAYGFLGTRYRFGGSSSRGVDCSSFVQQVFRELEVSLPRTAREQFEIGNEVVTTDLQKGDLVFFRTYAPYPSHVGIYLGNSKMIHASSRDRRVVISTINTPYYRARFIGAKRIAKINPDIFRFDDLIEGVEEEPQDDTHEAITLN